MKKAYVFLATGFEEVEAIGTIDVLRRGGMHVVTVSMTGAATVKGGHDIPVVADGLFEDLSYADADILVLPGGGPMLNDYEALKKEIVRHHDAGKPLAAICAAPLVFGGLGLLEGKRATCYPGFEEYLKGATVVNVPTVTDGSIITGRGPGLVFDFGLAILEHLEGLESAKQVAKDLLLK